MAEAKWVAAVPFFQRAIQLDPKFAMAYARLGTSYANMGESTLAAESTRKAYEMREGVSEGEKFYIDSHYYQVVIGDQEKPVKCINSGPKPIREIGVRCRPCSTSILH